MDGKNLVAVARQRFAITIARSKTYTQNTSQQSFFSFAIILLMYNELNMHDSAVRTAVVAATANIRAVFICLYLMITVCLRIRFLVLCEHIRYLLEGQG